MAFLVFLALLAMDGIAPSVSLENAPMMLIKPLMSVEAMAASIATNISDAYKAEEEKNNPAHVNPSRDDVCQLVCLYNQGASPVAKKIDVPKGHRAGCDIFMNDGPDKQSGLPLYSCEQKTCGTLKCQFTNPYTDAARGPLDLGGDAGDDLSSMAPESFAETVFEKVYMNWCPATTTRDGQKFPFVGCELVAHDNS